LEYERIKQFLWFIFLILASPLLSYLEGKIKEVDD